MCKVDGICIVTNAPCSCNTLGGFERNELPEICVSGQFCYEKSSGCQDGFNRYSCEETNPNFELLTNECVMDDSCKVTNAPCLCGTNDICTTGEFCYKNTGCSEERSIYISCKSS